MQQQTVEVKEVDVLIRGIWSKKKFTDIYTLNSFLVDCTIIRKPPNGGLNLRLIAIKSLNFKVFCIKV